MPKRSNNGLQTDSEPAAKRSANQNENQIKIIAEQKLQSARTALDRLDYKNAFQTCVELIDSHSPNAIDARILRSLTLEKQGNLLPSIRGAEKALKAKKSRKTYLRCSFAHLAIALQQLELAQQQPMENESDSLIPESDLIEFSGKLKTFKSLEDGNSFRRVSEDLFLQMASFFDSPSLVIFAATSKKMKSSIQGSKELFKNFKMDGKGEGIVSGIKYFNGQSGHSIKSIDIGVKNKLSYRDQMLLESAVSRSSSTLKHFLVSHQADLCKLIIQIASKCQSLKSLSSTKMLIPIGAYPRPSRESLAFPLSSNLELEDFCWNGGDKSLVCDEVLLNSLQRARQVIIMSTCVTASWIMKLLSSASSTLTEVRFPDMSDGTVDEIPISLELPNLGVLRLYRAPCTRSTQESFFKSLRAPHLKILTLGTLKIQDISSMNQGTRPKIFTVLDLLRTDTSPSREKDAGSLVEAIKDWKELRNLDVRLAGPTLPSFYTHLIELLTPLSQKSVESGYGDLLPKLQLLTLGDTHLKATATPISADKLAVLIGTRLALWRGLSFNQVSSIAAGDLSQIDQQPQRPSFAPVGTAFLINTLTINVPLEVDDEVFSWLEKKVPLLRVKYRITPKDQSKQDSIAVEP